MNKFGYWMHNHLNWLGHILEGLVMMAIALVIMLPFTALGVAALVGAAFGIGHFHGREKRDFEIKTKMKPPHLEAYIFWKWQKDQHLDFWPTAGALLGVALLVNALWG